MRRLLALVLLTAVLVPFSAAAQSDVGLTGVTDFNRSACRPASKGLTKAIAIRVIPDFTGETDLIIRDGETQWQRAFRGLQASRLGGLKARGRFDVWVLYSVDEEDGRIVRFRERFVFGASGGGRDSCAGLSDQSNTVSIGSMAPRAVQMYAEALLGSSSTDEGTNVLALGQMLARNTAASTGIRPSVTVQTSPSTYSMDAVEDALEKAAANSGAQQPARQRAPDIANACGVPVAQALVEFGRYSTPRIIIPQEQTSGVQTSVIDDDIKEPLSVMCFAVAGKEDSLFRVPLPAGTGRCEFSEGRLACWRRSGGFLTAFFGTKDASEVTYPPAIEAYLEDTRNNCALLKFEAGHLITLDIDQDGDKDYLLNSKHAICDGSSLGGNYAFSFTVFTMTSNGLVRLFSDAVKGVSLFSYDGFAVVEAGMSLGGGNYAVERYQLRRGKLTKIGKVPPGGKLVHEASLED